MQRRAVLFGLPAALAASGCRPQVEPVAGRAAALVAAAHAQTRHWVIQNEGFSTRQENELLSYEITGHYRCGI